MAALAAVGAALTIAVVSPAAQATQSCQAPAYPHDAGYFTSLSVTGVSCKTGRTLVLAYYRCRSPKPAGRCHQARVLGFSCSEHRGKAIATEYTARVTCTHAKQRVVHTYQQNT